eukprot:TRINITY_DN2582_c0_g1_i2.p2 TRINITY_DN2582_c0_g1~~TRINITY_DN2582_c0_g1_i2.p2  ORF type:complete len:549 (+),score=130.13 TRINITY_DN2582_c0_g1_i2:193-1647(+)
MDLVLDEGKRSYNISLTGVPPVTASCLGYSEWSTVLATKPIKSGKHEWEVVINKTTSANIMVGVCEGNMNLNQYLGQTETYQAWSYYGCSSIYHNGSNISFGSRFNTGDVVKVRLDMDAGSLSFGKNDIDYGVAYSDDLKGRQVFPAVSLYTRDDMVTFRNMKSSDSTSSITQSSLDIDQEGEIRSLVTRQEELSRLQSNARSSIGIIPASSSSSSVGPMVQDLYLGAEMAKRNNHFSILLHKRFTLIKRVYLALLRSTERERDQKTASEKQPAKEKVTPTTSFVHYSIRVVMLLVQTSSMESPQTLATVLDLIRDMLSTFPEALPLPELVDSSLNTVFNSLADVAATQPETILPTMFSIAMTRGSQNNMLATVKQMLVHANSFDPSVIQEKLQSLESKTMRMSLNTLIESDVLASFLHEITLSTGNLAPSIATDSDFIYLFSPHMGLQKLGSGSPASGTAPGRIYLQNKKFHNDHPGSIAVIG